MKRFPSFYEFLSVSCAGGLLAILAIYAVSLWVSQ